LEYSKYVNQINGGMNGSEVQKDNTGRNWNHKAAMNKFVTLYIFIHKSKFVEK
jgi:hypothetical protein